MVRLLVGCVAVIAAVVLVQLVVRGLGADSSGEAAALAAGVIAVAVYAGFVRLVERRAVDELAPARAAELIPGFLGGALLFTTVIAILWLTGACDVKWGAGWSVVPGALAAAAGASLVEEILVRGLFFRLVEEVIGTWYALALSAAIFGLLHAFNPNATVFAAIAIALEAGVLLAAAFVVTRRLWLAIGLHAAWNFTQGGIFGASVSGHETNGLLESSFSGSDLLTGGDFGPEASIVAVIVCLLAGVGLLALAVRRRRVMPPSWRMSHLSAGSNQR